MPSVKLKQPTNVLQEALENVRKDRTIYRARYIPLDELYTKDEFAELMREFSAACNDKSLISDINLQAILLNMNFELNGKKI